MLTAELERKKRPTLFEKGRKWNGNSRGRETKAERLARRDAIIAAWCQPFGGAAILTPGERTLLEHAAELSMCKPRNAEDRVRHANSISRIMTQCGLVSGFAGKTRRRSQPQPASPFDALLGTRDRA